MLWSTATVTVKKVFKSSADIVAVTPEGKITAVEPGQANITFTQEASNNYLPATHSLLVSAYGMPMVKNITFSRTGNVLIGSTLAATYDFYSQDTGSNASLLQWYYKSGKGKWLALWLLKLKNCAGHPIPVIRVMRFAWRSHQKAVNRRSSA